jgi:hypothetical protein
VTDQIEEMQRFLTYLNESMERVYADPSIVPGSNFDEKALALIRPHVPPGWTVYLKGKFSLQYGRAYSFIFWPAHLPPPPADFDIRLVSPT